MRRRSLFVTLGAFTSLPVSALYDPKPLAVVEAGAGHGAGT